MNHRRLSLLALPIFAAAACTTAPAADAPAATPTPAALRARLDALVPPIVDRSANTIAASASALGAIAVATGLRAEPVAPTPWTAVFFGGPDAGARTRAWLGAVLSDDAFDGTAFHVDPALVCGGDAACSDLIASADLQVRARSLVDDGVELDVVRGTDERQAASITLTPAGAHVSVDLAVVAPIAVASWSDPDRGGRVVDANGLVDGDLVRSADGGAELHLHLRGPIRIVTRPTLAPVDAVTSFQLGVGSSVDAQAPARGHGPVVIETSLVDASVRDAGGETAPQSLSGEVVVQDGIAAITNLELAAP